MPDFQYNSQAQNQDCVSEVLSIAGATSVEYPINELTRNFNNALDWYFGIAFEADGRWNYDDFGEASPPIDFQNIVSGTNRYKLSSFTEKIYRLLKIEILGSGGKGRYLQPDFFQNMRTNRMAPESGRIQGVNEETFQQRYINPGSGTPSRYCKYGDFIYLDRKPNYNSTNGLIAYFNRPAVYMTYDDTTDSPGITYLHIPIVCKKAALPWLLKKNKAQYGGVKQELMEDEQTIRDYFSYRGEDVKNRFIPLRTDTR